MATCDIKHFLWHLLVLFILSGKIVDSFYYFDDEGDNESLVSGHGSGCATDIEDCLTPPNRPNNTLIDPVVKVTKSAVPSSSTASTKKPTTPVPAESDLTTEVPEYSGGEPCADDDDVPCGSGEKAQTDDIDFTQEESTTPTHSILITANMTETPTKHNPPINVRSTTPRGNIRTGVVHEVVTGSSLDENSMGLNIGLIVGIAAGVVLLLLILAYALYKYRSRDEGTYKVDETKNYRYETVSTKAPNQQVNGNSSLPKPVVNGSKTKKKGTVKEWYV